MAPPIPRRPDLLNLNSLVSGVVHDPELQGQPYGETVRAIWDRVREAQAEGTLTGAVSRSDINALVSLNAEQVRAERELGQAVENYLARGVDSGLTGSMFARDLDTPAGAGFGEPAVDRIRFQITTEAEGTQVTRWVTYQPLIEGPSLVSDLMDMLREAGQEFADRYGENFVGLGGGISITYV